MKCEPSTISRIVKGEGGVHLVGLEKFLETIGMKIVDANNVSMAADQIEAMRVLAITALSSEATNPYNKLRHK